MNRRINRLVISYILRKSILKAFMISFIIYLCKKDAQSVCIFLCGSRVWHIQPKWRCLVNKSEVGTGLKHPGG